MMIAKLKMAGAAALSVAVLTFVATGLAAMVAAAPQDVPTGRSSDRSTASRPHKRRDPSARRASKDERAE